MPTTTKPATTIALNRTVANLHRFCAKQDSRPALATVEIGPDRATAADGFYAATVELADGPEEPVYLPRDEMKKLASRTTIKKHGVALHPDGAQWVGTTEAKPGETFDLTPVAIPTFPDVEALTPTDPPRDIVILSAEMLEQVAAFFKTIMDNDRNEVANIEIRTYGPDRVVEFYGTTPEGKRVHALQMPMVIGSTMHPDDQWIGPPVPGVETPRELHPYNQRLAHDTVEAADRQRMLDDKEAIKAEAAARTEEVTQ